MPHYALTTTSRRMAACLWIAALSIGSAAAGDFPDTLFERAIANDPIYRAQRAATEAGLEAYRIRRGTLMPQINATASAQRIDSDTEYNGFNPSDQSAQGGSGSFSETYNNFAYGINLRQPVFRGDLFSRLERGRIEVMAAEVSLRRARQELVGRMTDAYFGVLAERDALQTANNRVQAVERNLRQVRDRFDVGQIASTGVREAEAQLDLARAEAIEAELALQTARDTLAEIVGSDTFTLAELHGAHSDVALKYPTLQEWIAQAMVRNSGIVEATIRYRLAEQDVRQADANLLPQLDVTAGYNVADSSDSFIGQRGEQASVGLELNIPIFSGGAVRAETRAARATYLQRAEELRTARTQAQTAVRRAFRAVHTADRRVAALSAAQQSSQAALEAIRDGYQLGSRTLLDVLDAEQIALDAAQAVNAARYRYLTSMIALELAAGTNTDADWDRLKAAILGNPVPAPNLSDARS